MAVNWPSAPLLRREPKGHPAACSSILLPADVELKLHFPRLKAHCLIAPDPADLVGCRRGQGNVVIGEGGFACADTADHSVASSVGTRDGRTGAFAPEPIGCFANASWGSMHRHTASPG